jgi:hypothetical protein
MESMGRFSLTVQACILLGKVFRHTHESPEIDGFKAQEARSLENTLVALTNVSLQEGRSRGIVLCSPTTICFRYEYLYGCNIH